MEKMQEKQSFSEGLFLILSDLGTYFLIGFAGGFGIATAIYILFF